MQHFEIRDAIVKPGCSQLLFGQSGKRLLKLAALHGEHQLLVLTPQLKALLLSGNRDAPAESAGNLCRRGRTGRGTRPPGFDGDTWAGLHACLGQLGGLTLKLCLLAAQQGDFATEPMHFFSFLSKLSSFVCQSAQSFDLLWCDGFGFQFANLRLKPPNLSPQREFSFVWIEQQRHDPASNGGYETKQNGPGSTSGLAGLDYHESVTSRSSETRINR